MFHKKVFRKKARKPASHPAKLQAPIDEALRRGQLKEALASLPTALGRRKGPGVGKKKPASQYRPLQRSEKGDEEGALNVTVSAYGPVVHVYIGEAVVVNSPDPKRTNLVARRYVRFSCGVKIRLYFAENL